MGCFILVAFELRLFVSWWLTCWWILFGLFCTDLLVVVWIGCFVCFCLLDLKVSWVLRLC